MLDRDRSESGKTGGIGMGRGEGARRVDILLVEDNPADVRLLRETLSDSGLSVDLHLAQDGVEAMAFLQREGPYREKPRPDLILLDLNLPKKSGREALAEIKADPRLRAIPVLVLTTSEDEKDVLEAYDLHANCYITKPLDLTRFARVVKLIEEFWLETVKLPKRPVSR
jgi:chemotaxis family two-component system response regulator Rcp1